MTARFRIPGRFVPLSRTFAHDERVLLLAKTNPAALGLYAVALAYVGELRLDGELSALHLDRLGFVDAESLAQALVEAGLWHQSEDGYRIAGWATWNPPAAKERVARKAMPRGVRLANHNRWHVARGKKEPGCPFCEGSNHPSDQVDDTPDNRSSGSGIDQVSIRYPSGARLDLINETPSQTTDLSGMSSGVVSQRSESRESKSKPASAFAERGLEVSSAEPNPGPQPPSASGGGNGRGAGGAEPSGHTKATNRDGGRGLIFEAILAVCDFEGEAPTENDKGRAGKATKELRALADESGMSHEEAASEVRRRAANYRQWHPTTILTPQALTGNWEASDSPPAPLAPKAPPQDSSDWAEYLAGYTDVRPVGPPPRLEPLKAQRAAGRPPSESFAGAVAGLAEKFRVTA